MDPDRALILTRNVFLEPLGVHRYAARASFATPNAVELSDGTLALLSCFTEPRTPREARAALGDRIDTEEDEFLATVEELARHGLLRDAEAAGRVAAGLADSGYADAMTHHAMLRDAARVDAYRIAIERHAPGRRVLEIGAGSGLLSILAARAGAAGVVALEESGAIGLARALARANGVEDRIEFLAVNSLDYRPEERAEVVVHELIGHEPFAEHALRYLEDARSRLLAPGGRMIPEAIEVRCRAVGRAGWVDPRRRLAEADEIGARTGLTLRPLAEALAAPLPVATFHRDADPAPGGARSGDAALFSVDFAKPVAGQIPSGAVEVALPIERGGFVNAIVCWFRARMDDRLVLSTAPEAPRTHWALAVHDLPEPRSVAAGDALRVRARLAPIGGRERMLVEVAG